MSAARIWIDLNVDRLDTGLLLYGRTGARGGCAAFRIVRHSGVSCRATAGGQHELVATNAVARYGALYSIATVANGWEPFAQPAPAAYLPRQYENFIRVACDTHTLLLERNAYRGKWSSLMNPSDEYSLLTGGATLEVLRPAAEWIAAATTVPVERIFEMIAAMSGDRVDVSRAA